MSYSFLINSLKGGGAEKQLSTLIKHLPYEKVYTLEKSDTKSDKVSQLSEHTAKTPNLIKILSLNYYGKKLTSLLSKEEKKIISLMTRANAVNVFSSQKSGHEPIICERTNPSKEFQGIREKIYKPIIKKTYEKAAKIITNSQGTAQEIIKSFFAKEEKITTVPNLIDLEEIKKAKEESLGEWQKIFEKSRVIISCGRLTNAKAQWRLLKIFSLLLAKDKELKLVILGSGELTNYLTNLSEALGLRTYFPGKELSENYDAYFAGNTENPYKFVSSSKIFVLSSIWEGFPNVLIEAMACGTPCISSNCAYGPLEIFSIKPEINLYEKKEIIEEDFGVLLPTLNPQKIYNAFEKPEESENVWAEYLYYFMNDSKKINFYKSCVSARALDFSPKKIIPMWERILYE
ncbi:MAG: glycosyltransferase [Elusimicrobia bacterium]|nr:glycosyltransferase [Elusimicrobiota bacterium]